MGESWVLRINCSGFCETVWSMTLNIPLCLEKTSVTNYRKILKLLFQNALDTGEDKNVTALDKYWPELLTERKETWGAESTAYTNGYRDPEQVRLTPGTAYRSKKELQKAQKEVQKMKKEIRIRNQVLFHAVKTAKAGYENAVKRKGIYDTLRKQYFDFD